MPICLNLNLVPCAVGQFGDSGACYNCPPGQYQDKEGQTMCNLCPGGYTTLQVGSISADQCISEFQQLIFIFQVKLNSYINSSLSFASFFRIAMLFRFVNFVGRCEPGTWANGTLCRRCPTGTYQEESGQATCSICPPGNTTFGPGATECSRKNSILLTRANFNKFSFFVIKLNI